MIIIALILLSAGCAEKLLDLRITNDLTSNMKYGKVTSTSFNGQTLTVSIINENPDRDALKHEFFFSATEVMSIAEKYPEVKMVEIKGFTPDANGTTVNFVIVKSATHAGVNWNINGFASDPKAKSQELFQSVEWYID